jgi:hypothetical protein
LQSPLMDSAQFTRDLEARYREIHSRAVRIATQDPGQGERSPRWDNVHEPPSSFPRRREPSVFRQTSLGYPPSRERLD